MSRQIVRMALLAGAFAVAATSAARAGHDCGSSHVVADCCSPCAPAAPQYCTVTVNEWVPETYQTTRTVYRTEQRVETYTAYRTESVPEVRTRTFTVSRMVPETRTETRTVSVCVPTVEERTVMQSHVVCRPVTTMVSRCVDRGHWECREVPCDTGCGHKSRWGGLFRKKGCCEASCCASSCDACCPPPMKTVRVWVPNMVTEQVPCTRIERVCEQRPVVVRCTVNRYEQRQESYQVTTCRCVSEQRTENYTVHTCRTVPYQATRTVCVSVPHQEAVTCTRMVCRPVQKTVTVSACCDSGCDHGCHAHKCKGSRWSGLRWRHGSSCGGCDSCCH